jgi:hypothetical protein
VTEAALAGAHIATVPHKILQMIHHPLTDSGIVQFRKDWEAVSHRVNRTRLPAPANACADSGENAMSIGYNLPLYLLPFDHRHSYVSGMFQLDSPLTATQRRAVSESKQVIYDGFRYVLGGTLTVDRAGVLVDEEFGAGILHDAIAADMSPRSRPSEVVRLRSSSSMVRRSRRTSKRFNPRSPRRWSVTTRKATSPSMLARPPG